MAMIWFDGGTYPADKQFIFLDRRFDVQIGEEWLTYQQDEAVFWNENLMEDAYEKCANEQSITIPDPRILVTNDGPGGDIHDKLNVGLDTPDFM